MNSENSSSNTNQSATIACQQGYEHWQRIINQQDEEIRQLRSLLLDVMNQYNCRSLRHDAIDYYRDLNQLQTKLDRLHRDLICQETGCSIKDSQQACSSIHFGLSARIERYALGLMGDFSRIKDGCHQLLTSMMNLNWL
ncbi:hypothetical protein GCM10028807_04310 [Spirosoma daeguense]